MNLPYTKEQIRDLSIHLEETYSVIPDMDFEIIWWLEQPENISELVEKNKHLEIQLQLANSEIAQLKSKIGQMISDRGHIEDNFRSNVPTFWR